MGWLSSSNILLTHDFNILTVPQFIAVVSSFWCQDCSIFDKWESLKFGSCETNFLNQSKEILFIFMNVFLKVIRKILGPWDYIYLRTQTNPSTWLWRCFERLGKWKVPITTATDDILLSYMRTLGEVYKSFNMNKLGINLPFLKEFTMQFGVYYSTVLELGLLFVTTSTL